MPRAYFKYFCDKTNVHGTDAGLCYQNDRGNDDCQQKCQFIAMELETVQMKQNILCVYSIQLKLLASAFMPTVKLKIFEYQCNGPKRK